LVPGERPTVHYTEIPEDHSASTLATEWNFYRREVGRLLGEGHEGRWLLIHGNQIIGIWDTEGEADRVRFQRFPGRPVLLKQIRVREPILRGGGYHRGWQR
jgi:hypothetical protein